MKKVLIAIKNGEEVTTKTQDTAYGVLGGSSYTNETTRKDVTYLLYKTRRGVVTETLEGKWSMDAICGDAQAVDQSYSRADVSGHGSDMWGEVTPAIVIADNEGINNKENL